MKGDFSRLTFNPRKRYSSVRMQQGRLLLEADWNEQLDIEEHDQRTERIDVIGQTGVPKLDAGFGVSAGASGDLTLSAGRLYIDGILCETESTSFLKQPDLPGAKLPTDKGQYLVYLDVWERLITTLDDPAIRETALGGPDTCVRLRTTWQARLLKLDEEEAKQGCDAKPAALDPPTGKLAARAKPDDANVDPCAVKPKAGYRRLENQLYRVEIHQPGDLGKATFKWSRDNGSIVAAWTDQKGKRLVEVSDLGRDAFSRFAPGQWVELSDDTCELNGTPGLLVNIVSVEGLVLTVDRDVQRTDFPLNPKVRRWDQLPAAPVDGAMLVEQPGTNGGFLALDDGSDGIEVRFEAGSYQTGDYWIFPARAGGVADIEWPKDAARSGG
jgi:hypothetical protein